MLRFLGKTAVVVGGGGSIGGAICRELDQNGARVAVCDYHLEAARAVAGSLANGGMALGVNVRGRESVEEMKRAVLSEVGQVDLLIYAAGGSARSEIAPLRDIRPEVIENVVGVNLLGAIFTAKAFVGEMMDRRTGKMLFITSILGLNGMANLSEYAASKGGVLALAKSLAKELGPYGINVNCISPGLAPRPEQWTEETLASMRSKTYINRVTMPADIAKLAAFLASEDADSVTGQNYIMDGGRCLANKGDKD